MAAFVYITAAYASDVKRGICISDWYLSKDICCQGLAREGEHCENFVPWSLYMFNTPIILIDFLIYTVTSAVFAASSCFMALEYSYFAVGSGLEEVKTILGGFSILL